MRGYPGHLTKLLGSAAVVKIYSNIVLGTLVEGGLLLVHHLTAVHSCVPLRTGVDEGLRLDCSAGQPERWALAITHPLPFPEKLFILGLCAKIVAERDNT